MATFREASLIGTAAQLCADRAPYLDPDSADYRRKYQARLCAPRALAGPKAEDALPAQCRRCGSPGNQHATAAECISDLRDIIAELSAQPLRRRGLAMYDAGNEPQNEDQHK